MKKKWFMKYLKNNKYYARLLAAFLITIITCTLISTGLVFFSFRMVMLDVIKTDNQKIIAQISYGKDYMDEQADRIGNTILSNNYILSSMTARSYDSLAMQRAISELNTLVVANSNIESLYFYNAYTDTVTTSSWGGVFDLSSFYDQDAVKLMKGMEGTQTGQTYPRIISTASYNKHVYTYVYFMNDMETENGKCAVIVNLKKDYLTDMVEQLSGKSAYDSMRILCLDDNGRIVNAADESLFLKDYSQYTDIQDILKKDGNGGTWIGQDEQGSKCVFSCSGQKNGSWIFVSSLPERDAFGEMRKITVLYAVFNLFILVITFWIAIRVSEKLYNPIAKLKEHVNDKSSVSGKQGENELETVAKVFDAVLESAQKLEMRERANLFQLQNTCIKNIITGEWGLNDRKTVRECEKNHISRKIFSEEEKALLLIRIDKVDDLSEKYSGTEREIVYFALINIVNEIIGEAFENRGCNIRPGEFCFLIQTDGASDYTEKMREISQELQQKIKDNMKLDVSLVIGQPRKNQDNFGKMYEDIQRLAQYIFIFGQGCIIDYRYFEQVNNEYYLIDWKQEKMLVEALKMGKKEEACRIYQQISDETCKYDYENIINTYFYLAYSLYNECCLNVDKEKSSFAMMIMPLIGCITEMKSKQEVDEAFVKLIEEIVDFYNEFNSRKSSDIVDQVTRIINENYRDPNICLNEIAQKINKAPSYVGRMFKEKTNKSVSEQIMDMRMAEIKRLLDETDLPLNTIVESVGLEKTNYFYTLFRKYFGVTVSAYDRKQGRTEK